MKIPSRTTEPIPLSSHKTHLFESFINILIYIDTLWNYNHIDNEKNFFDTNPFRIQNDLTHITIMSYVESLN